MESCVTKTDGKQEKGKEGKETVSPLKELHKKRQKMLNKGEKNTKDKMEVALLHKQIKSVSKRQNKKKEDKILEDRYSDMQTL